MIYIETKISDLPGWVAPIAEVSGGISHFACLLGCSSSTIFDVEGSIAPGASKVVGLTNETFWLKGDTERPADLDRAEIGDFDLEFNKILFYHQNSFHNSWITKSNTYYK